MLIVLSETLRARDLRTPLTPAVRDALINLSTAAHEGMHLIAGSRLLFGELQQLAGLGSQAQARFKAASAAIDDAFALRDIVSALIRVEPRDVAPSCERLTAPGHPVQLVFHLPLDFFADSARVGSSCLIGEHLRDAQIYITLGKAISAVKRYRGLHCILRARDGHGGETPHTLRLDAAQEGCVLCVVDSDRDSADGPLGTTATATLAGLTDGCIADKPAAAHVLPCRELENLIPPALVLGALTHPPAAMLRAQVEAHSHRLGLGDFADLKHLVKLQCVCDHLAAITPHKVAEAYLRQPIHPALHEVSTLAWSFGLAAHRRRT